MKAVDQAKNIFILGIKGIAMANLAVIFKRMGKNVIGSDSADIFPTDIVLQTNNIPVINSFKDVDLPENIDLAIYSAAHGGLNHPQIQALQKKGIFIINQAEIISELLDLGEKKIAVCGCHGKTTTASLLAYSLIRLQQNPSYLVGAPNFNEFIGGNYDQIRYFVVEADEYGINPPADKTPKFLKLNPNRIICTNIDFDHPDVYENLEVTQKAFSHFFEKVISKEKTLIVCGDDHNLMTVVNKFPRTSYLTYGFSQGVDLLINNYSVVDGKTRFRLNYQGQDLGEFQTLLFGEKNVSNASAVVLQLLQLGFSADRIKEAIEDFAGAKRRFEKVFENSKISLFDDYSHHPMEIKAAINAAKSRFPDKKIVIIFQPHTFSRTKALLIEFNNALSQADISLILPIFPSARENSTDFQITSKDIQKARPSNNIIAFENKQELLTKLSQVIQPESIIFTMGAGDVYELKNDIIKIVNTL